MAGSFTVVSPSLGSGTAELFAPAGLRARAGFFGAFGFPRLCRCDQSLFFIVFKHP